MNWLQKLYETYNNCSSVIGSELGEDEIPLLPICHTTQKAQIEITIDEDGDFLEASVIPKNEARTIIPCTEKSGGRTSGEAPHPLCDKLQYIAKDYKEYGGDVKYVYLDGEVYYAKKSSNSKDYKASYYKSYIDALSNWLKSTHNEKVLAIYKYVNKGTVIADLVSYGILVTDSDNQLIPQRRGKKGKNAPTDIFDLLPGRVNRQGKIENWQADAFIRWRVEGELHSSVWDDTQTHQDWIDFYTSTKAKKELCYVIGEKLFLADQNPAKIRSDGDKAKLISSNDESGFTYRGRFETANEAATVGFETTQKAHAALRWLIGRQGYRNKDQAIVAWATSGDDIPQPFDDLVDTQQDLAIDLRKKIAGYNQKIDPNTDVVVMSLDSATTGRMAITYYRALKSSDFLEHLDHWHESCAWLHTYKFVDKVRVSFIGAPAPKDIALAAYGVNRKKEGKAGEFKVDDNLAKSTANRILPCILDGLPIPRDIVESVVRNASNRVVLEDWQWKKTLSIACALYKKYKDGKEKYNMALDETRTTRDYLYGRLLAIADRLEEVALYDPNDPQKKRATNATRYMQQFSLHPYRTWGQIHSALIPYMVRLENRAFYFKSLIAEVKSLFLPEDFKLDKPLSGEYLLGYYCQYQKFFEKKENGNLISDEKKTK